MKDMDWKDNVDLELPEREGAFVRLILSPRIVHHLLHGLAKLEFRNRRKEPYPRLSGLTTLYNDLFDLAHERFGDLGVTGELERSEDE